MTNSDLLGTIKSTYQEAQALERKARQHPDNLDCAPAAAEKYLAAAHLSGTVTEAAGFDAAQESQAKTFAAYYESQHHKCMGWFYFQRHEAEQAIENQVKSLDLVTEAIRLGIESVPSLPPESATHIENNLISWELQRQTTLAAICGTQARQAWDSDNFVTAIDRYRDTARHFEAALKYVEEHGIPEDFRRIITGNYLTAMGNTTQAIAMVSFGQANNLNDGRKQLSPELGRQLIEHTYRAYKLGHSAYQANPEWPQILNSTQQLRTNIVEFLQHNKDAWPRIYSIFENEPDFLEIMRITDLRRYKEVEHERHGKDNKAIQLWSLGSFWLFVVIVLGVFLAVLFRAMGLWVGLFVVISIEALFLLIGAFALRSIGDLGETNFLKLIVIAGKFQLDSILTLFSHGRTPPPTEDEEN